MKAKKKLLTLLILSAGSVVVSGAGIAAVNKLIKMSAVSRNLLSEPEHQCYKWRLGDIYYTKTGSGKPLLLIHDLSSFSCGFEWSRLIPLLQEQYTIYTIDLLGCGRSEKINMTYTNYLYVQLITDFIHSVIGRRTNVIATGEAASIPIMACYSTPSLFDQIMLINLLSLLDYSQIPGRSARFFKFILDLPVIGTMIYHMASSRKSIETLFTEEFFCNPVSVTPYYTDRYYEAAHLGAYPKAVFTSCFCNYTKCNLVNALKKIDNSIYLVGGAKLGAISEQLEEYKKYNSSIETFLIPNTRELPQMEAPGQVCELIQTYL